MSTAANVVIAPVQLLQVSIRMLGMFLWDKPAKRRALGQTCEFAAATQVLAAHQGLYAAATAGWKILFTRVRAAAIGPGPLLPASRSA